MKYLTIDKIAAATSGILEEKGFGAGLNYGKKTIKTTAQTKVITNVNQQIQKLLNNTLFEINNKASQILNDKNLNTKEIKKAVNNTQQKIDNFIRGLQSQLKVLDVSSEKNLLIQLNNLFNEIKNTIQNNNQLNSNINIEEKINILAQGLSRGLQSKQYKGDISEALVAIIGQRLSRVALNGVNSIIKDSTVSGQERSSRGIVIKNFTPSIN